jgi:hypothetical protein
MDDMNRRESNIHEISEKIERLCKKHAEKDELYRGRHELKSKLEE